MEGSQWGPSVTSLWLVTGAEHRTPVEENNKIPANGRSLPVEGVCNGSEGRGDGDNDIGEAHAVVVEELRCEVERLRVLGVEARRQKLPQRRVREPAGPVR
jgi:hypothetical protein